MATLITEMLDRREMQKYLRGVADVDMEWVLDEVELDADELVRTVDNGIAINEELSERCLIKYELWDQTPPPLTSWDRSWTGSVHSASGKIATISSYSGGTSRGKEFDLGRRGGVWNIRTYRKRLEHEEFTAAIVSFTLLKLQFWPAARPDIDSSGGSLAFIEFATSPVMSRKRLRQPIACHVWRRGPQAWSREFLPVPGR